MISKKMTRFVRILLITAFIAPCLSAVAFAANYYVDSVSGNDSNTGALTAPWRSVAKVKATALKAGDAVYFKCGGAWDELLSPATGASGNPVVYGAYGTGNRPVIRGFSADGKSYVRFEGITFKNGSSSHPGLITNSSHHISVVNCDIIADTSNSTWAALYILNNSHHNEIIGCNIEHRNTGRQSDAVNLRLNANYNLIKNNKIGAATHYALSLEGNSDAYPSYTCNYNVIVNNVINNPNGAQMSLQSESSNNVVDGNIISGGKSTSYCANLPRSFKNVSRNNIIRRNVIKDNTESTASGLGTEVYAYNNYPANIATGNRTYNNVMTNINKYPVVMATNGDTGATAYNNIYKNNIVYNNISAYQAVIQANTAIKDNYFQNNLFYKSGVTNVLSIGGVGKSVAGAESGDPSHWVGNVQKDPYLGVDFRPVSGSPCIDTGAFLTSVTSASGSGYTITVADARYFTDGYGIFPGDLIRVGSTTANIAAIDYSTNKITFKEQMSWQQGAAVSLPYSGNKPDIGAFENGNSATALLAPMNLRVVN